jgi:cytoskeletal protein CcmA (bactofilin family)
MGLFGKPDPRPGQEPAATPQPQAPVTPPKPASRGTIMGEKTRYNGKIQTDEALLVLGQVEGEITSTSEVEIGDTGVVTATIKAKSIAISGRVNGDCVASDRLEIRASGKLNGSIQAARIAIADGAEFKGTSQMTAGGKA